MLKLVCKQFVVTPKVDDSIRCDCALGSLGLQFSKAGGNLVISYQSAGDRFGAGGLVLMNSCG